ncbi:MauE/DoxX family redox-associated membrane protein [Micromonospora sp. NPDC051300]|uniref:MauE/DoxX family redox-associated membrane protein n=1 Tax=Micromonospora sp. NPDC051300 TaxID=3364286 RepID=UPI003789D3BF
MTATLLHLSWICRGTLAMVFAVAVFTKIRGVAAFVRFRDGATTLTGVRGRPAALLAGLVVAGEAVAAAGSVVTATAPWAAATAGVLLSAFTWRLARTPGSDVAAACGCFGSAVTTRGVGLLRNVVLLAVSAGAVAGTLATRGTRGGDLAGPLVCVAAAALLAACVVRLHDIASAFLTGW